MPDILMAAVRLAREDGVMGAKRRSFTPKYRREAAHLVIDTDRTIAAVAAEISVGAQLLGRWVQAERDRMGASPDSPLDVSERAELERLRTENLTCFSSNVAFSVFDQSTPCGFGRWL